MSGGGDTQTIKENADPWAGQQPYLGDVMAQGADIYRNAPSSYYSGQTWLPFNEMQNLGMYEQLGNVSDLQGIAGQAQGGLSALTNAPYLESNPYAQQWASALDQNLGGMYDRMSGRVADTFNEQIMPGISGEAAGMGQSGSSRQGVAEGMAAQGAQQELSDLALQLSNQGSASMADFYSSQYGQGLDAAKAGVLSAPSVAATSQMPYQSLYGVGDMLQQQAYLPLQEDMARWNYNQSAPWNDLAQYQSAVTGIPAGLGTKSSEVPGPNKTGTAVGGAAAGATTGYTVGGPWGALIGGILGGAAGYYG